ncbi:NAD(P)-dependent oxidoreductase [Roseomonas sp. SSH11]|uniref:NAD(P)-dependent oxidoreductase n=1 Tax=Pararoseomonas baculiformis TaxID=2820812 RepID=A0ABS4AI60_9PROT|nr:NAD(P)-dependent oxidoreductase [Pararoseomonas baculiformis]MBP0446561.1 NAD(P)-dependent oxidoreductase [Pararoseomonas baculiformis]
MRLGFIGLGNIGGVMARRLAEHGHGLVVHDINPVAAAALAEAGAELAGSPEEVASRCEWVFLSLPTPAIVRQVASGVAGGSAVKAVIDLSTTGASMSARVAEELAGHGIRLLDAPVSGGVAGARKGTLAVMTSGPRDLFEAVEPLLRQIGQKIFYLGAEAGQAQTMKVVNNLMAATSIVACCEGLVFGAKAGIDTRVMIDVLNASSGRSYATEHRVPNAVLDRSFPTVFTTELMYKDVKLCLDEAEKLGMPMWIGPATRQFLAFAMSQGSGPEDLVSVIKHYERWAQVEAGGEAAS